MESKDIPVLRVDRLGGAQMEITFRVEEALGLRIRTWVAVKLIHMAAWLVGIAYVDLREE